MMIHKTQPISPEHPHHVVEGVRLPRDSTPGGGGNAAARRSTSADVAALLEAHAAELQTARLTEAKLSTALEETKIELATALAAAAGGVAEGAAKANQQGGGAAPQVAALNDAHASSTTHSEAFVSALHPPFPKERDSDGWNFDETTIDVTYESCTLQ
jgi:hypothetical protein